MCFQFLLDCGQNLPLRFFKHDFLLLLAARGARGLIWNNRQTTGIQGPRGVAAEMPVSVVDARARLASVNLSNHM